MSPLDSGRMEDQMKRGYGGEDEGVLKLDGDDVKVLEITVVASEVRRY